MPEQVPSADEVRAALDELLGWQGISRSPQVSELLRYVVEKKLAGDENSIKAYSIAVDVFGRPQSFDPQSDPIVRVQARRLRALLDQFYSSGRNRSAVQIHLPLGRYVPDFTTGISGLAAGADAEGGSEEPPVVVAAGHAAVGRLPAHFWFNAALGLCFTLIGVALAVAIVRVIAPSAFLQPGAGPPGYPLVAVGTFDNLTGDPALDGEVARLGPTLGDLLGRFDVLRVGEGDLIVSGGVQENGGRLAVRAQLTQGSQRGIVWSATVMPEGTSPNDALADAAVAIAAQLGTGSGPLHTAGRAWLKAQAAPPDAPTAYVCDLFYIAWRDARRLGDAASAADCFTKILGKDASDAHALAALAGMQAWRVMFEASPTDDLIKAMGEQTTAAARAVTLKPQSSFVYEQEGLVLARQGSLDAAVGALNKAVELNPASMDARAVDGVIRWLNGDFDGGNRLSEAALAAVPSPAPFFYMTRAFNALRQRRFFDAIDAGQSLAAGDEELGAAIVVAAAPQAARNDLIDRYRPLIMNNPHFQSVGILPRLGMTMKPQVLLDAVREGLTLAGIPTSALTGPFNPDGTAKVAG